jgi:hypothetical protein
MQKIKYLLLLVIISYIACCTNKADADKPFKIPTLIRDSACVLCMPYYIDSLPKMGDDSVLGIWASMNDKISEKFYEFGQTHGKEDGYLQYFIKRDSNIILYRYSFDRRKISRLFSYTKPEVITYTPEQILYKGDYVWLNGYKWTDTENNMRDKLAISFTQKKYRYLDTNPFRIIEEDTFYYEKVNGLIFKSYRKPINSFEDLFMDDWNYSKQSAINDTNTLGRWYGLARSYIRIFKKDNKYYELWYWADGTGDYNEVKLEYVKKGIKVIPVFKSKELEKEANHYKLIDFTDDYTLKRYYGTFDELDDEFPFVPCYKYCEQDTDSMYYYGYDSLLSTYKYREPIFIY